MKEKRDEYREKKSWHLAFSLLCDAFFFEYYAQYDITMYDSHSILAQLSDIYGSRAKPSVLKILKFLLYVYLRLCVRQFISVLMFVQSLSALFCTHFCTVSMDLKVIRGF